MGVPWDDPEATGYGRMVGLEEYARFVQRGIDNFRKKPDSLMGRGCPHVMAIIDFADRHKLCLHRDHARSYEIWGLGLGFERMEREIWVVALPADWFDGWRLDIRSMASWINGPGNTHRSAVERRWFGTTTAAPPQGLADSLELALQDAKSYTLDELIPFDSWLANSREPVMRKDFGPNS